ncbi:MAG: hypothetical protein JKX71_09345 [Amylibacter sp.]|nr:hypothetical protein [Amylibacter sp.]
MRGTCVSGDQDISGKVYVAIDNDGSDEGGELKGFAKGDIFVCKMMNPAWLPYALQSKGFYVRLGAG